MWVIAEAEFKIACFATLSMTSVDRSACPARLAKAAPAQVPALLVGRLAADNGSAGLGLATEMAAHLD